MKKSLLHSLLAFLLFLGLSARATTPPPTGRPLAEALNPDGTLKMGINGSFDARQFRMSTAPDGRPVFRPAEVTGAGDERWADGFGLPNGTNGSVNVVLRTGTDMYIGGSFSFVATSNVDGVAANFVAKWNGTRWSSLGTGASNGVDNTVSAMALASNGDLYVGGLISQAGGVAVNGVARWNGTFWSPLGTGLTDSGGLPGSGRASALVVAGNGDLYAGGRFAQAGGVAAANVAKWNGTAWSALGTGFSSTNSTVNALALASNGDVYAGGGFTQAGGAAASNVAKWNGTAWSSLGAGINGAVATLAVAGNGDVYAGGTFTQAGGVAAVNVAKWNGTAWGPLNVGLDAPVRALVVAANGEVYAGGYFTQAGGVATNYVAKWNGTGWSPLGTGTNTGLNGAVNALALAANGDVYVGGSFLTADGKAASCLARWSGTAWNSLGLGTGNGVYGGIYSLVVASNGDVYVGGSFSQVGGVAANNVAKWNGTVWSPLGTGTAYGNTAGNVLALALASNGDLYAGGNITQAGGVTAYFVAKWNGTTWSSLGTGMAPLSTAGAVLALAVAPNGDVYAGGRFTQAGGVAANRVAKWNGSTWSALGTGFAGRNDAVNALAIASNGDIYAGGIFTQSGGGPADYIAKWNGTAWIPLGAGVNGSVGTLATAGNGDLYAGGAFTQAGGGAANGVAKWDGTSWSSLGAGLTYGNSAGGAIALAVASNGDVYAGGYFAQAGGVTANNVAKWNGTAWSALGTGLNGTVSSVAIGATGKLHVGGGFAATGDISKLMSGFAIYDPNAPLATASAKAAPAAQLYPNPAHGTATLRLPAGAPRLALSLTDALGRTVRRYPASATAEAELDLRGLPTGAYVVRCGEYSQRLVVE